ncbi:hypothetical protein QCA50_012605 [Cerrena zonata]|uniref:Uncharacterized protein n=1 Tax=Cerrena zonata TaxID=2478898 RepID=A0AAW0FTV9_9APHY
MVLQNHQSDIASQDSSRSSLVCNIPPLFDPFMHSSDYPAVEPIDSLNEHPIRHHGSLPLAYSPTPIASHLPLSPNPPNKPFHSPTFTMVCSTNNDTLPSSPVSAPHVARSLNPFGKF